MQTHTPHTRAQVRTRVHSQKKKKWNESEAHQRKPRVSLHTSPAKFGDIYMADVEFVTHWGVEFVTHSEMADLE